MRPVPEFRSRSHLQPRPRPDVAGPSAPLRTAPSHRKATGARLALRSDKGVAVWYSALWFCTRVVHPRQRSGCLTLPRPAMWDMRLWCGGRGVWRDTKHWGGQPSWSGGGSAVMAAALGALVLTGSRSTRSPHYLAFQIGSSGLWSSTILSRTGDHLAAGNLL